MTVKNSTKQTPKKKAQSNILEQSKLTKASALSSLKTIVPQIFMDAQRPNEHLRSDSIRLRDVQLACCLNSPRLIGELEDIDYEGEALFIKEVFRNINKILPIRKKEPHADRIVRFIAGFLQYNQQKDGIAKDEFVKLKRRNAKLEAKKKARAETQTDIDDDPMSEVEEEEEEEEEEDEAEEEENKDEDGSMEEDDDEDDEETISSRFVGSLLRHLLKGFTAKGIFVRTRCCQIIALSISSMGEIDEDLYQDLRTALFDRIIDKEASVRIQAATTLCRLQSADADVDQTDGKTILQKLMWCLQNDPSSEVRRVILFNIDPIAETLPYIVERARDVDAINRRVVYLKPLSDMPDFRMLSFEERNQILKWGLHDRNPLVKKAVSKMLSEKWISHANNNLIEFLERLDIMKPEVTEIAESVLDAFFTARMDIVNDISFDAEFWNNLTPESAFLAKVLIKFLQKDHTLDERLDSILPEVTRHAFNLKYYNDLYRSPTQNAQDYEFITTQMLETAMCLDYADEVGRRKMFELLRDILKSCELSEDHLSKIVRIFRLISLNERDFTRTIIEIIFDIQEQLNNPDELGETPPAKKTRLEDSFASSLEISDSTTTDVTDPTDIGDLVIRLRCLSICKRMLENSQESLTENSNLYGLLNDLIVPAVQNSDVVLREEGLHCLGLCCTLDKTLAQHNVALFIQCIKNGHEGILKKAIVVLFDLMMTYGVQNLTVQIQNSDEIREVFEFCIDHDTLEIQTTTTEGLAKLMLAKRFQDDEILRLMILLYFFPVTDEDNNKVQQCLTYFFPAYSYSSADHQISLSNVTILALEELCNTYSDLKPDEIMVNPMQISDMLADWTDPRKLAKLHLNDVTIDDEIKTNVHGRLAIEALNIIYNEPAGLKRKTMCHFILRLYLEKLDTSQLAEIKRLMHAINIERPIKEVLTRNAFTKLLNIIESNIEEYNQENGLDPNPETEKEETEQEEGADNEDNIEKEGSEKEDSEKDEDEDIEKEADI
ncbi:nuclear condensing complex subunit [Helicostylum pulchrum]|nr:nuclear condensing complex subunit [Helicostylum pulchrum]